MSKRALAGRPAGRPTPSRRVSLSLLSRSFSRSRGSVTHATRMRYERIVRPFIERRGEARKKLRRWQRSSELRPPRFSTFRPQNRDNTSVRSDLHLAFDNTQCFITDIAQLQYNTDYLYKLVLVNSSMPQKFFPIPSDNK